MLGLRDVAGGSRPEHDWMINSSLDCGAVEVSTGAGIVQEAAAGAFKAQARQEMQKAAADLLAVERNRRATCPWTVPGTA